MKFKRRELILGALLMLVIGGGATWLRAKKFSKMPTPQRLEKAFPSSAKQVFEDSQQFTLLSLDPDDNYTGKNSFHGYRILGQAQVSPKDKAKLIAAFYNGMAENKDSLGMCFSPQHGIHAVQGTDYVDLVICFHCLQVAIYSNNKRSGTVISQSPQATFDGVLKAAGILPHSH